MTETMTSEDYYKEIAFGMGKSFGQKLGRLDEITTKIKERIRDIESVSLESLEEFLKWAKDEGEVAYDGIKGIEGACKYPETSEKVHRFRKAHEELCYYLASLKPWGQE